MVELKICLKFERAQWHEKKTAFLPALFPLFFVVLIYVVFLKSVKTTDLAPIFENYYKSNFGWRL